MSAMSTKALLSIEQKLRPFPPIREVFEECLRRLISRDDVGIIVSGSLAHGTVDRYSDLDLEVVAQPQTDLESLKAWVVEEVSHIAPLLASFPASHLGLKDLFIFFHKKDEWVVKTDIWVMGPETFAHFPTALILRDPGGFLSEIRQAQVGADGDNSASPDFEDLHNKFTGWIWYTYTKISRGEFFEAANSLETMRSYALLPFLQLVENLPLEGYRHLETRVSPERLSKLSLTLPAYLQPDELMRVLRELIQLFSELQEIAALKMGPDIRFANLAEMAQIIEPQGWRFDGDGK
jgi:predicted nucleotidyltransferase